MPSSYMRAQLPSEGGEHMTRFVAVGLVVAGVLAMGCRTRFLQTSVHPFVQPTEPSVDVTGRWVPEEEETQEIDFVQAGENAWRVDVFDAKAEAGKQKECLGVVHFGRVGSTLYWDLTAAETDSSGDTAKEHLLGLHSLARLRLDGETMEIALLDPEWMSAALADGRLALAHFRDEGENDILTAPTADIEAFLATYGEEPEAFGEPEVFHRAP